MLLNEFKDYWDEWHKEWSKKVLNRSLNDNSRIKGWPVPSFNVKVNNDNVKICNLFPEPYWGADEDQLRGIFLSINPGKPQDYHNIVKNDGQYFREGISYRNTIQNIALNNKTNSTVKWMMTRLKWLRKLTDCEDINLANTLMTDLVPWHTEKKSEIQKYLEDVSVQQKIIDNVLIPIIEMSQTLNNSLKGKIIVRGSSLLNILNDLVNIKPSDGRDLLTYDKSFTYTVLREEKGFLRFASLLTIVSIANAVFFIFSGGPNMNLPDLDCKVYPVDPNNIISGDMKYSTLKEFILFYPH